MSSSTVLIPIRAVHGGKTRLAERFDEQARSRLVLRMATHVLSTVVASGIASRIMVVTRDRTLASAFDDLPGIEFLIQPPGVSGLNGAIGFGRDVALTQGASHLLVLSADLPTLSTSDLLAIDRGHAAVTIVSDRFGEGTNALQLRGQDTIDQVSFEFGPHSNRAHLAMAEAIGASVESLALPGAGLDIDTVVDWEELSGPLRDHLLGDWQSAPRSYAPELMLMEQS